MYVPLVLLKSNSRSYRAVTHGDFGEVRQYCAGRLLAAHDLVSMNGGDIY